MLPPGLPFEFAYAATEAPPPVGVAKSARAFQLLPALGAAVTSSGATATVGAGAATTAALGLGAAGLLTGGLRGGGAKVRP